MQTRMRTNAPHRKRSSKSLPLKRKIKSYVLLVSASNLLVQRLIGFNAICVPSGIIKFVSIWPGNRQTRRNFTAHHAKRNVKFFSLGLTFPSHFSLCKYLSSLSNRFGHCLGDYHAAFRYTGVLSPPHLFFSYHTWVALAVLVYIIAPFLSFIISSEIWLMLACFVSLNSLRRAWVHAVLSSYSPFFIAGEVMGLV